MPEPSIAPTSFVTPHYPIAHLFTAKQAESKIDKNKCMNLPEAELVEDRLNSNGLTLAQTRIARLGYPYQSHIYIH